jgi:hypothetical protein
MLPVLTRIVPLVAAVTTALAVPETVLAAEPCPPGTPSAERFSGLPARLAIGKVESFSLDFGDVDWDVDGPIHVTMSSDGKVFSQDDTTDPLAEFWLRLDHGNKEATVTATFEQTGYDADFNPVSCVQTISRTVTGFVAPVRLTCNEWDRWGDNIAYLTKRPRRCSIWRENWSHAQSASFIKARWQSWGKPVARARATLVYNMGYRARVRVKAYRLRFDCTGRHRMYTRVFIKGPDGKGTVRPDTCAD